MNRYLLVFSFFIFSLFANSDLTIKTSYYIPNDDLTLSEIKNKKDFIYSNGENFGIKVKRCWLKLEIENNTNKTQTRVFKFRTQYIDYITVYKDGNIEEKYGDLNKFNKNIPSIGNEVFKVDLTALEKKVIYIKLSSHSAIKTFLNNYSYEQYIDQIFFYKMLFYFSYGILFSMILYNFIIWYMLKMKIYFYYIVYHFIFFIGILTWTGFGFEHIWYSYPILNYYSFGIIANIIYGLHILFIITFIDTQKDLPKITLLLKMFAYLFFFLSLSSLFIKITVLYEVLSILSMSLTFGTMVYMFVIKKSKLALYAIISNIIIVFGSIFMALSDLGLTNGSFWIDYFFVWGTCFEVILMSFALAYQYKILEKEKDLEKFKRVQLEDVVISKHKLSTMGEMMTAVVHQWRQPLTQINSVVYSIENDFNNNRLDHMTLDKRLDTIESTTNYLSRTINDFKNFSIYDENKSEFLLKNCIEDMLKILSFTLTTSEIDIDIKYSNDNISICSNKNELTQVFMIILYNAKDAIIENKVKDGKIKIEVEEDNKNITIKISNNGGAIQKDIIDKIFDQYFTTKQTNNTGLGLYIAKLIINKLQLKIDLTTNNNWTTFIISSQLPKNNLQITT